MKLIILEAGNLSFPAFFLILYKLLKIFFVNSNKLLTFAPAKTTKPSGFRRASVTCSLPRWAFILLTRGAPLKGSGT